MSSSSYAFADLDVVHAFLGVNPLSPYDDVRTWPTVSKTSLSQYSKLRNDYSKIPLDEKVVDRFRKFCTTRKIVITTNLMDTFCDLCEKRIADGPLYGWDSWWSAKRRMLRTVTKTAYVFVTREISNPTSAVIHVVNAPGVLAKIKEDKDVVEVSKKILIDVIGVSPLSIRIERLYTAELKRMKKMKKKEEEESKKKIHNT